MFNERVLTRLSYYYQQVYRSNSSRMLVSESARVNNRYPIHSGDVFVGSDPGLR